MTQFILNHVLHRARVTDTILTLRNVCSMYKEYIHQSYLRELKWPCFLCKINMTCENYMYLFMFHENQHDMAWTKQIWASAITARFGGEWQAVVILHLLPITITNCSNVCYACWSLTTLGPENCLSHTWQWYGLTPQAQWWLRWFFRIDTLFW